VDNIHNSSLFEKRLSDRIKVKSSYSRLFVYYKNKKVMMKNFGVQRTIVVVIFILVVVAEAIIAFRSYTTGPKRQELSPVKGVATSDTFKKEGQTALLSRNFDLAVVSYDQALKKNLEDVEALRGAALSRAAKIQAENKKEVSGEALLFIDRAIGVEPEKSENYQIKGYIQEVSLDCKSAVESYNRALALDQKNAYAYSGLGHCMSYFGDEKQTDEFYGMAHQLSPNDPLISLSYASHVLMRKALYDEAMPILEKISIDKKADSYVRAEADTLLGNILMEKNDFLGARKKYELAIQSDSSHSISYVGKGRSILFSILSGKSSGGTADIRIMFDSYDRAQRLNPNAALARYWQGTTLRYIGRNDLGKQVLLNGLEVVDQDVTLWGPDSRNTLKALFHYQLAAAAVSESDWSGGVGQLRSAFLLDSSLINSYKKDIGNPLYFEKAKGRAEFLSLAK